MRSISGKDLTKVVERHGWSLLRVQSSHHIYGKQAMCGFQFQCMVIRH